VLLQLPVMFQIVTLKLNQVLNQKANVATRRNKLMSCFQLCYVIWTEGFQCDNKRLSYDPLRNMWIQSSISIHKSHSLFICMSANTCENFCQKRVAGSMKFEKINGQCKWKDILHGLVGIIILWFVVWTCSHVDVTYKTFYLFIFL
jgi:hypothetical protein